MYSCHAVIAVSFIPLMVVTPLPLSTPENSHCAGVVDAFRASEEAIRFVIVGRKSVVKTAEVTTTTAYA